VGAVRRYDPARGFNADWTVLAGVAAVVLALLLVAVTAAAWRDARRSAAPRIVRPSKLTEAAAAAGLGVPAVLGIRLAVGSGQRRSAAPVRSALVGSIAAIVAVTAALVFGGSLQYLTSHPPRYGWTWNVMLLDQGGYGDLAISAAKGGPIDGDLHRVRSIVGRQRGVAGWSLLGFALATVDGHPTPLVGLDRQSGSVQPPTSSGAPLGSPDDIDLGVATMRQLHRHIGDSVVVSDRGGSRRLTIVGTTTFASVGIGLSDHPSLGVGALIEESTLLGMALPHGTTCSYDPAASALAAFTECPSTIVVDLARGTSAEQFAARVDAANPDPSTPGGTYDQPRVRGAQIVNSAEMSDQPLLLAALLGVGALASLALTQLAEVRRRRHDLAVLKSLGLKRSQLRSTIAWQATLTSAIALVVGVPVGIIAGRLLWIRFATSLGVITTPAVPVALLAVMSAGILVLANLAAAGPAIAAARTPTARLLTSE
jgi:FtsX-like permease family protein